MPVFEHVSADTRYPWSYFTHEPLDELAALVQEAVSRGALPPECFEYRRSHNVMNFLLAQLSGTTFIWDDFYVRHTDLMRLCGVNYGLFRGPGGEGVFSNGTGPSMETISITSARAHVAFEQTGMPTTHCSLA
jgi:hypothetical protein